MTKMLLIIFEKLWQSSSVPSGCKGGNIILIFTKGNKRKPRKLQASQLHLSAWQDHGVQNLQETVLRHMDGKEVIGDSQGGFTKSKQHQWIREQQLTSSPWIFVKQLTLSCTTSLSPNWR